MNDTVLSKIWCSAVADAFIHERLADKLSRREPRHYVTSLGVTGRVKLFLGWYQRRRLDCYLRIHSAHLTESHDPLRDACESAVHVLTARMSDYKVIQIESLKSEVATHGVKFTVMLISRDA